MGAVQTVPKIDTPVVIPDFGGDPHKAWRWLRNQAQKRGEIAKADELEKIGACHAQTISKVGILARHLGIPLEIGN